MFHSKILSTFKDNDPIMHDLFQKLPKRELTSNTSSDKYFLLLAENIIGQQLSIKVADVIVGRFHGLFGHEQITPEKVLEHEDLTLRELGLSWAKVKYVKDLASKTVSGDLIYEKIPHLTEEEVIAELTKVKGIGRWTAEMFLIFTLGREDVFSFGDLGLRRGIERNYGFQKDTPVKEFEALVEKWQPYRSYASLALWHSLDNSPKA